jgi:hypothetical protein
MENAHRVLKPGGTLEIEAPHGATLRFLGDPTQCTPITCATFRYFEPDYPYSFYTTARFRVEQMDLDLPASPLRPLWQRLWKKRMWWTERLLVHLTIDFGLRVVLRKDGGQPAPRVVRRAPGDRLSMADDI